ncbi:transposable element Tcb2 transposase [Trichonephila clavipes]|nr:transposable element Tcb2 transposase [Trichonephila clavipes]
MSSRHHIDDFMRGRIIGKIEEGRKITDVAREFDIAHSVVSRLWKSFKTTGMCSRRHGGGRVRTGGKSVSCCLRKADLPKTVARRLRGGGLYARRPVVCVPLTRQHRTARFQWCREHHNWTEQDWACVLLSDESRFSLSSDCRRQLIWRESGTAYRPENIQEKDRYPTCSNMVWAGIMINGRTRLHVVANGTMTGQRYIDEVLLPHVRLFRGAVGDKFVFMDDNATCHRTLSVQDCLDSEGIQRLVWPARSPDLNPIENVWDALGRQVAGRNYPPTNKNTLIRALTEEWDKLSQQLLDNVVQSMNTVIAVYRYRSIAACVDRDSMTVSRIWNRWFQDGNTERRAGSQRPPITSIREDRHFTLMVLMNRAVTSRALKNWESLQDNKCLHEHLMTLATHQDGRTRVWQHRGERTLASVHSSSSYWPINWRDNLSLIENVLSMIAERLACHHTPVTTVDELWHRVEAAWASVPVHAIQSLFDSMPRYINAVIIARGGCSEY